MRLPDLSDDDPLKFYLPELATVQPLTSRERADLLKQIRSGNNQAEQARKRLIEANLSMVVSHCRTIQFAGMSNAGSNPGWEWGTGICGREPHW